MEVFLGLGFTSATQSILKFIGLSDCLVSASQVAWATGGMPLDPEEWRGCLTDLFVLILSFSYTQIWH